MAVAFGLALRAVVRSRGSDWFALRAFYRDSTIPRLVPIATGRLFDWNAAKGRRPSFRSGDVVVLGLWGEVVQGGDRREGRSIGIEMSHCPTASCSGQADAQTLLAIVLASANIRRWALS